MTCPDCLKRYVGKTDRFFLNCRIIYQNNNLSQLSFLEAYYIKTPKPEFNDVLKAFKELDL